MELMDVIKAAGARVSGGDPYLWRCYGRNSQFMEFRDTDQHGYAHCIYDTYTYEVYEVHVEVPLTTNEAEAPHNPFVWYNPKYRDSYIAECNEMGLDPTNAWDDVSYTEITDEELILQYVKDIGETYYDDIPVPENNSHGA
jgi:hypothetical protein